MDIPIVSVLWTATRALGRWWQSFFRLRLMVVSIPGQRSDVGRGWFEARLYLDGKRELPIEGAVLQLGIGRDQRHVRLAVTRVTLAGEVVQDGQLREGQPVILAATIPVDLPWEEAASGRLIARVSIASNGRVLPRSFDVSSDLSRAALTLAEWRREGKHDPGPPPEVWVWALRECGHFAA